jgi:uncharacterized protein (DUF58 family)
MINIFIVIAVFFVLYKLQEFVYGRLWDKNLSIDIEFSSPGVFEGETVGFKEHVWNGKRLPMPYVNTIYTQNFSLRQTDTTGKEKQTGRDHSTLFVVPGHRHVRRKSLLLCEKRGYYTIDNASLTSSDLFFTRVFMKDVALNANLTVYPKEIEVSDIEIPYKRLCGEILTKRFILPDPFEFTGIREYQPFDSLKQLNYNAWAKTGSPMSNTYGYTVSQEVRIILNLQRYSVNMNRGRDGIYENAIRLAAFLARKYLEAGIAVSFATNGLDCITNVPGKVEKGQTTRHLREIYEILARMDLSKSVYCEHIAGILPDERELRTEGLVVALISSLADEHIYGWFESAKSAAADVLWVAPRYKDDRIEYQGGVTVWEVCDD